MLAWARRSSYTALTSSNPRSFRARANSHASALISHRRAITDIEISIALPCSGIGPIRASAVRGLTDPPPPSPAARAAIASTGSIAGTAGWITFGPVIALGRSTGVLASPPACASTTAAAMPVLWIASSLTSTVWADGLVDLPAGQAVAAGDVVRFLPLHELVGR